MKKNLLIISLLVGIIFSTNVIAGNKNLEKTTFSSKLNTPFSIKNTNSFSSNLNTNNYINRAMFNMYIDWNFHLGATKFEYNHHASSGYARSSYASSGFTWGGGLYFTFGARIYDYAFVGLGFGSELLPSIQKDSYFGSYISAFFNLPIYLNLRGYFPATSRIFPYLDVAIGPSVLFFLDEFDDFGYYHLAFNLRVGIGIDFSRFSLGLGYEGLFDKINTDWEFGYGYTRTQKLKINAAYLKLGIRIGPME